MNIRCFGEPAEEPVQQGYTHGLVHGDSETEQNAAEDPPTPKRVNKPTREEEPVPEDKVTVAESEEVTCQISTLDNLVFIFERDTLISCSIQI